MNSLQNTTALTPPPLNQGQEDAAEAFFEFLFSEHREFVISGPPGVGKTFLMGHIIDKIIPRYRETCKLMGIPSTYDEVVMTATTNKAAQVLGRATNRPTSTLPSFLNLKVSDDIETGRSKLEKTQNWVVHSNQILFVDEASMTDGPLWTMSQEGLIRSKIVWVGDHCQLAPVGEKISPVFTQGSPTVVLTQQMRNSEAPALMALCDQLRETVETGIFKPIQQVPGQIDFLTDADLAEGLEVVFKEQTETARVLCYENKRVIQYNDHIRTNRGLPDEYQTGEWLVNANAFRTSRRMVSVEEEVQILARNAVTEKIEIMEGLELEVRKVDLATRYGGEVYRDIQLPVDRHHYAELLKWLARNKKWATFFKLKGKYPDLRQPDAATVHKAQGSTHEWVFVDLGNISRCHQPDQAARLLYVAISRARKRVFLYGDLAEKYGGLLH